MWLKSENETKDILDGKVAGLIGSSSIDANRAGSNFMENIYFRTGLLLENYARAGSHLTASSENYKSEFYNQIKRLEELPTTVDFVLAQIGVNDDISSRPLGTWESTSYTEFYFCLHEFCKTLYTRFPNKPKGVMTGHYFGENAERTNAYVEAIKEVCAYYSIPVLDLKSEGQTPYNIATWKSAHTEDALHLNNAGNEILSRRVEAFIRQLLGGTPAVVHQGPPGPPGPPGSGGGGTIINDINEIDGVLRRDKTDIVTYKQLSNLFDKSTVTSGYVYMSNGTYQAFSNYSTSALIEVEPGKTYSKKTRGHYTFWREDGTTFVSGIASAAGIETFTVPNNPLIKYMRFAIQDSAIDTEMMVEGTAVPSFYIPFGQVVNDYFLADDIRVVSSEAAGLSGLKWAVMGDSISSTDYATKPYQDVIAERTGVIVTRYAVSGSAITKESGRSDAMSDRWSNMIADADIITVMGGRNDFTRSLPIGTKEDRTNTTLYGACHVLFGGLVDKYKGKRIGVILPPQRPYDANSQYNDNDTVYIYLDAIQEVAEYYSIPVLDLFRHGGLAARVPSIRTALYFDNVHPNNAGQEVISRRVEAFIRQL